jgi:hypothetical protein
MKLFLAWLRVLKRNGEKIKTHYKSQRQKTTTYHWAKMENTEYIHIWKYYSSELLDKLEKELDGTNGQKKSNILTETFQGNLVSQVCTT